MCQCSPPPEENFPARAEKGRSEGRKESHNHIYHQAYTHTHTNTHIILKSGRFNIISSPCAATAVKEDNVGVNLEEGGGLTLPPLPGQESQLAAVTISPSHHESQQHSAPPSLL